MAILRNKTPNSIHICLSLKDGGTRLQNWRPDLQANFPSLFTFDFILLPSNFYSIDFNEILHMTQLLCYCKSKCTSNLNYDVKSLRKRAPGTNFCHIFLIKNPKKVRLCQTHTLAFDHLTHWAETKWSPFHRRHFQTHFPEWQCTKFA